MGSYGRAEGCVIAQWSSEKAKEMLIDSGATHYFFYSKKSSLISCEEVEGRIVKYASGLLVIVGNWQAWLPIDGGICVQSYQTPHFSTNIWSVELL